MSSSPSQETLFQYGIDADDRIVHVDDAWLAFAQQNDAPGLDRPHVLGQSIWTFVSGRETRYLYELVFAAARRRQEPLVIPFRCDSPGLRRFMELRVTPRSGGHIALDGVLIRAEPRPEVKLLSTDRQASAGVVTMCSWCKRVRLADDSWVEVEQAIRALQLFGRELLPAISHGICPDCVAEVTSRV